jgi:ribosomal protein L12E/L44/L45/RPP1/RPP2
VEAVSNLREKMLEEVLRRNNDGVSSGPTAGNNNPAGKGETRDSQSQGRGKG